MKTEIFSKQEKRRLKQRLSLPGAVGDCAAQAGIHRSTVTRALKAGTASKEVTGKLRMYLQVKSKLFIELPGTYSMVG